MNHAMTGYGLWSLVLINSAIFITSLNSEKGGL